MAKSRRNEEAHGASNGELIRSHVVANSGVGRAVGCEAESLPTAEPSVGSAGKCVGGEAEVGS